LRAAREAHRDGQTVVGCRRPEQQTDDDRTERWYVPGGTLEKVNVPSAAVVAWRVSSSIWTVTPPMGSPESELSKRPDTPTPDCAVNLALNVRATNSTRTHVRTGT
jgi:hypothetical protein